MARILAPLHALRRRQPDREASYIITKDPDGVVYAINGRTGEIDFSGPDAAAVIQKAINALPNGGVVFVKDGDYGNVTLSPPSNVQILLSPGAEGITVSTHGSRATSYREYYDFIVFDDIPPGGSFSKDTCFYVMVASARAARQLNKNVGDVVVKAKASEDFYTPILTTVLNTLIALRGGRVKLNTYLADYYVAVNNDITLKQPSTYMKWSIVIEGSGEGTGIYRTNGTLKLHAYGTGWASYTIRFKDMSIAGAYKANPYTFDRIYVELEHARLFYYAVPDGADAALMSVTGVGPPGIPIAWSDVYAQVQDTGLNRSNYAYAFVGNYDNLVVDNVRGVINGDCSKTYVFGVNKLYAKLAYLLLLSGRKTDCGFIHNPSAAPYHQYEIDFAAIENVGATIAGPIYYLKLGSSNPIVHIGSTSLVNLMGTGSDLYLCNLIPIKLGVDRFATGDTSKRAPSSITVGSSPFTFQNTNAFSVDVIVSGGTVLKIEWSMDGSTWYDLGAIAGRFRLRPGEYLRVTYTSAPTMIMVPL